MIKYILYFVTIFSFLISISLLHYWFSQDFDSGYYLFLYGFLGMFLGAALLLRWSNVDSSAQLANRFNEDKKAEIEDKNSLKYGSLVLSSSLLLVIVALSTSTFL